jgi:GMP synthase (glutamine-hydrolysing)
MSHSKRVGETAGIHPPLNTRVAILDAGAQLAKSIDRRVRGLSVQSDIFPLNAPFNQVKDYGAYIISGGPESVYLETSPRADPKVFKSGKPILGICYGMQLINHNFGGAVAHRGGSYGPATIKVDHKSLLFDELREEQKVLLTHGDSVVGLAPGFLITAKSSGAIVGIADNVRNIYGVQFHPEDHLTENGTAIISNFLFKAAKLKQNYEVEDRLKKGIKEIRETVGKKQVLAFVSGGVDSTVLAAMLGRALPAKQIHAIHVDTGFMRLNESALVKKALFKAGINLKVINAEKLFLNATTVINGEITAPLNQVIDPEIKRQIIGDTFMKVRENVIAKLNLDPKNSVLAQGTLRPDLIESASSLVSSNAQVIKTHHNDTQLVRTLREEGGVIEPLRDYHKDEVREIGEMLGLHKDLVWRQPFPGPGLAIRLICAKEPYITKDFDRISSALKSFEEPDISAHLLPVRTVGVQGDGRSYSYLVGLSGAQDWRRLFNLAHKIPNSIKEVNRVVYIFGKQIKKVGLDITPTYLTKESLDQLRLADSEVNKVLTKYGLDKSLSQVPVIAFPVNFGVKGARCIGIRTLITPDFYTGIPALPGEQMPTKALEEIVRHVQAVPGIARVVYDLTSKPPATTEWE